MSLTAPPSRHLPPQPAPLTLKARLMRELRHWEEMPGLRLCLLLLPSILLLAVAPLLPLAAGTLWWWAAHSWDWRDRWTSVRSWAKQGGAFVALVLVFAILSTAQVWVLPQLTATLQAFWHAHLGGDLSLSPTDLDGLVARALLLLPLAPALALLYEWIDPRTQVQLQRILTPADLVEPTPAPQTEPPEAAAPPRARKKASATPKAKAATSPRKRTRKREQAQQITIESFLAPEPTQAQATPSSPSHQAAQEPVTPSPSPQASPAPPAANPINWDDVAN
jgi:hypothetical protein